MTARTLLAKLGGLALATSLAACASGPIDAEASGRGSKAGSAAGGGPVALTQPVPGKPGARTVFAAALVGKAADAVLAELGEPALRLKAPGSELWRYGTGFCILLVAVYDGEAGAGRTIRHAEWRRTDREDAAENQRCELITELRPQVS